MSVQSLNGDSYQGGQVGANIQSQVGKHSLIFVICNIVRPLVSPGKRDQHNDLTYASHTKGKHCLERPVKPLSNH